MTVYKVEWEGQCGGYLGIPIGIQVHSLTEEDFRVRLWREEDKVSGLTLEELVRNQNSRDMGVTMRVVAMSEEEEEAHESTVKYLKLEERKAKKKKKKAQEREVCCVWCNKSIRTMKLGSIPDVEPKHYEFL